MFGQLAVIWKFRYFWMSLVRMDLRQRYRRSIIGVGWSLLNPILMTVVFCLVFSQWFVNPDWRKFAPYFLTGLSIWDFIRSSALGGCQTFFRNEGYIRQCPLPLTIYSLRTLLYNAIHFLIAMAVVVLVITILARDDHFRALKILWAVLPAMILLMVFCWAISVITSFITVFFHDSQQLLEVFFQLFFFLTPIMYPVDMLHNRGLGFLADWNPAVMFFSMIREPLLSGESPSMSVVGTASAVTLGLVFVALFVTKWLERKLIFRL